jgi:hypothetical protein
MAAEQNFIKWPTDTLEPASDEEFTLLSELLERAFSKNTRVALAESKHDMADCGLLDSPARRAP